MATITIKNIPDDLYVQLKQVAEANRRSINSEVIVCIERRLASHKPGVDETLQKARLLRELTAAYPISDEVLDEAIRAGRP
ncbi:MAG: Arc family DNA-binding protein [Caldilineaceae bacterium]|nr:Arc family DNA-binding protein [Caldilineaceae bacterium]